jgi:hypothetical protein
MIYKEDMLSYTNFISTSAKMLNADFKEIELLFMLFIMIILGGFYRFISANKDSKYPYFSRRFYGFFFGLIIHYKLLTFNEFLLLNLFLVTLFFLMKIFNKTDKQKFWLGIVAFLLHSLVGIYIVLFYYGVWYSTHLFMITMLISPKMMYFIWRKEGTPYLYFLIFR